MGELGVGKVSKTKKGNAKPFFREQKSLPYSAKHNESKERI